MKEHRGIPPQALALFVTQARHGDKEAFEALYYHFARPMTRYALIRVNDPMLAEDLVQNVWVKVEKRLHRLQDISLFQSWLYRALRWEILDWAKSRRPHEESHEHCESANDIQLRHLPALLAALNETEREVVGLVYLNGLSVEEAALALSIPAGTVKSRLSRARDVLRNTMYEELTHETG